MSSTPATGGERMRVWLIQPGEPLPSDPGTPRLYRTGLLAAALVAQGHEVLWWASTFRHTTKRHRARKSTCVEIAPGYRLFLLHSPGYGSNLSPRRFLDHRILGFRFRAEARKQKRPDIIHCGFPTIELAYEASRYGREFDVPLILDARDMWPDIFIDVFPMWSRSIGRWLFNGDFRMTRAAFRSAAAISGHVPGFVEWGLAQAQRPRRDLDRDFPFGYPSVAPDEPARHAALDFWRTAGLDADHGSFVVCFFGTFAQRREVDLVTVMEAARALDSRAPSVKLVLCGDGPSAAACREAARGLGNVLLPGWIDSPRIWTLMRKAKLGLLPYLPSRDFALSIPNKAVEYLSAGLPVLTSLRGGYLESVLRDAGCGRFYSGLQPQSLVRAIEEAVGDPGRLEEQSGAAERLFEERFRAENVNCEIIAHMSEVVRAHRNGNLQSGNR